MSSMSTFFDDENYYSLYETRHEFFSQAIQINNIRHRSRAGVDIIPITFLHFKVYVNYDPVIRGYLIDPPTLLLRRTLKLRFSREKAISGDAKTRLERFARYKRVIAGSPKEANKLRGKLGRYLCKAMGLPEYKHPYVIEPLLAKLKSGSAVPDKAIDVTISDLTCRDTEESMHMNLNPDDADFKPKMIPASESFILALEEASPPDDDELECAICMEMFAHASNTITRLPCSHYYHRDCIIAWLHINHLCPTCRHPNPQSTQGS